MMSFSAKVLSRQSRTKPQTCRLIVIGEKGSGKTSIIFRFTRGRMPSLAEMGSTMDIDFVDVRRNGNTTRLSIIDTSGDDTYAKLRALCYNRAHCVIICLPLDSKASLLRIQLDLGPEVRYLCQRIPYLLVGTKMDARDTIKRRSGYKFITEKQGKQVAKKIGAVAYLECSALGDCGRGKTVKRVFSRAIKESIKRT